MIKLISKQDPDILAFRVKEELEKEDVDWLIERVEKKEERMDQPILLYIEFENFGELTFTRMWAQFKKLLTHVVDLMAKVNKIAVVTSDVALRDKLSLEFALIPTINFKTYKEKDENMAVKWLTEF
ncbi:SpoIIAA family protein [Nonlabens antarcticus]|uniref:STAS/SEC14 domain-containing protein n=1 Tax=Nonlabens antarcticus TaxID=392714 RepID=UPI0018910AE2|nr:STAS/SEC14 domain-containing protein [Nonlabens antarcticus]